MSEQLDCFLKTRLMLGITQRHRIVELGVVALRVNHAELEAAVKKTLEKPGLNIFGSSDDGPRKRETYNCRSVNCIKQSMDLCRNNRLVPWKLFCRVRLLRNWIDLALLTLVIQHGNRTVDIHGYERRPRYSNRIIVRRARSVCRRNGDDGCYLVQGTGVDRRPSDCFLRSACSGFRHTSLGGVHGSEGGASLKRSTRAIAAQIRGASGVACTSFDAHGNDA